MKTYPIHERFMSWQGEGRHMGRAAFFIRLFGCPLHCPWCDSAGTWHKDYVPEKIEWLSVGQLVQEALATRAQFVVITGGEPAIHDLAYLISALHSVSLQVHIETSGAFHIKGKPDWVTVSPKRAQEPLPEVIEIASEFKWIIETPDDVAYWMRQLLAPITSASLAQIRPIPIWLHPEWSKRADPGVLSIITETVITVGDPFRAGWQLHKLYRADNQDPRSVKAVPLGGNPSLGY